MEFLHKISQFIQKHQLLKNSDKVVVGVSGGMDSMTLYHALQELGYKCTGVHLNYHLRGEDSDKDAELVKKQLGKNAIIIDISPEEFQIKNQSLQEIARTIRFREFENIRKKLGFDKIAVATHLNDNIETFFINFLRGGGLKGLKAILPENGKVIRPFLETSREEIEQYARKNSIAFRHDQTNFQEKYLRNKIRWKIIPELKKIQPSLYKIAIENFELLRTEHDFLENHYQKDIQEFIIQKNHIFQLNLHQLQLHPSGFFLLSKWLLNYGFSKSQIIDIYKNPHEKGTKFLSENFQVFFENPATISLLPQKYPTKTPVLTTKIIDLKEVDFKNKDPFTEYIDEAKVQGDLKLRKWKKGDFMSPLGMKGRKKISDILIDEKVPVYEKENVYVVEDEKNIIWLAGYRISELYKISPATKNVSMLKIDFI